MNKQKILYFSFEQWKGIVKYKEEKGLQSDSAAVYALVDKGLSIEETPVPLVCSDHYDVTEEFSVGPKEKCFRCLQK